MSEQNPSEQPANTRVQQRQQTKQRIYEAAILEFGRMGVDNARVEQICKAAGVAKGTFFFHFPTKDHILLLRQQQISESMAERIDTELETIHAVKPFLKHLVSIICDEHEAVGNAELVQQINLAIVRQSGAQSLQIGKTAFGAALTRQISRMQCERNIRPDMDAIALAECLRLSLFGFLVNPQTSFSQTRNRLDLWVDLFAASLTG